MSKLFRALGLESDAPPVVPVPEEGQVTDTTVGAETPAPADVPVDAPVVSEGDVPQDGDEAFEVAEEEGEDLIEEGTELNDASDEVSQTVVTLEKINTILAGGPEDQINETTADIIDAAMQDIDHRFEIEVQPKLSKESFHRIGATTYRQIAKEEVGGKLEAFKKGLKTIVEKIVLMVQKFWQWLTMNHKRVKASLAATLNTVKNRTGSIELQTKIIWHPLLSDSPLTGESILHVGNELVTLSKLAQEFILASFGDLGSTLQTVRTGAAGSLRKNLDKTFSGYKHGKTISFYSNFGNRSLTADTFDFGPRGNDFGLKSEFEVELIKAVPSAEMPEKVTITQAEVVDILTTALSAVDASEKEFNKINGIQKKQLGLLHSEEAMDKYDPLASEHHRTKGYQTLNNCLVAFIDGIFMQSLRYGNAVASMGNAYAAQAGKTA